MTTWYPLVVMSIGIAVVIGLIMAVRVNAFFALISAAILVSLLALDTDSAGHYLLADNAITRVAEEFGKACGNIGISIGLAAVIGSCMMDSGAADRIVRSFMGLLGEKRAPWALMGSGYVLSIPVFFDTVFYLLVPLARSFYRRTGGAYLKCLLAITAGGAVTHTLVPPTPGPLTMAANLNIDMGKMILVGALVAFPAAVAGLIFAALADRLFPIPMREIPGQQPNSLQDHELPGLIASFLPVLLPVVLIAIHTIASAQAEGEQLQKLRAIAESQGTTLDAQVVSIVAKSPQLSRMDALAQVRKEFVANEPNLGIWTRLTRYTAILGNPNLALLISAVIAMVVYVQQRRPTKEVMEHMVEASLMSGGVIILITAAGSAFGGMLKVANVGLAIRSLCGGEGVTGISLLFLGFGIAALLKIAQGSSTAAMIITTQMMAGMIQEVPLPYDKVYLATAIGSGSLVGSWMNDSGFWIFAKMGGLSERETLMTWTPLLVVLAVVGLGVTVLLAQVMPLTVG